MIHICPDEIMMFYLAIQTAPLAWLAYIRKKKN